MLSTFFIDICYEVSDNCASILFAVEILTYMLVTRAVIEKKLTEFQTPYLTQDLMSAKVVRHIEIDDARIKISLVLGYPALGFQAQFIAELQHHLASLSSCIEIDVTWKIAAHTGQKNIKGLPHVKNIIAVASGKGGVGKSTVAVNLALSLAADGATVGILDADIYGPSQPMMLGATEKPVIEDKKIFPVLRHGIQSMSIGYLVADHAAMVWRGPMISMALQQLLNDTEWRDLDYLIVDLPPGTGDIQLTLAQKIPVSGVVIVTTPQDLALADVRRACEMFGKVNIPVLGIVENMSFHICSSCGHSESIFGTGGGLSVAEEFGVELLGQLPLDIRIREQTDAGIPSVVADPTSDIAMLYRNIARSMAAKLSLQAKDYSGKFPAIVVEK